MKGMLQLASVGDC